MEKAEAALRRPPVWRPRKLDDTNIEKFRRHVNTRHDLNILTYQELHQWSTDSKTLHDFWVDAYEFLNVGAPGTRSGSALYVEPGRSSELFPLPTFFPDARLNLAEILLRNGEPESTAIHFVREGVEGVEQVTWRDLRHRVERARGAMLGEGIQEGDRVPAVISNSVDAIVICLAALSIGALYSSASPDLGSQAIVDRFVQIKPKLIFADNGFVYAGKLHNVGAVLNVDLYEWFYKTAFPCQVQLVSMSGGTDISGAFVSGTPTLPVYAGEIQAKCLGMAIDVCDPVQKEPQSVEHLESPGELVCTQPVPSQPLGFYGSDGDKRYRASYFERYGPTVWCQGDLVQIKRDTGGIIMLGRSDGVLNPSGVRFGSAEIYTVTDNIPDIQDAICVGRRRPGDEDETVLLFVKPKPGLGLSRQLTAKIKAAVKSRFTPRHVPKYIFQVDDIPYTVNGKKCEINVKQVVNGQKAAIGGTVANPESITLYERYFHLEREVKRLENRLERL